MESLQDLMDNVATNHFDEGSEHWVYVTHINNPHSFFVRPTAYEKHMSVLNKYEDQLTPDKLHPGAIIIYKSKILKKFVRGRVMFVQNEGGEVFCGMFALDYGCYDKSVPIRWLRQPTYSKDILPLAVHCQLADCLPIDGNWHPKIIENMKYFIGKEQAKMFIRGTLQDLLVVELDNSCPDDISTMLAYMGHSTFGYAHNMINRFAFKEVERLYFTYKACKIGETLHVRVQSGDSLNNFYVAEIRDYERYLHERENFNYFSRKERVLEPEKICEGMAVGVLVMSSNKFERAIVKKITKPLQGAEVQLVDWGKVMEVPFIDMYFMSEKFFTHPVTAIFCSADESQAWDNGLPKFLYPGYEFHITIAEVGDQFDSPNIVNVTKLIKNLTN